MIATGQGNSNTQGKKDSHYLNFFKITKCTLNKLYLMRNYCYCCVFLPPPYVSIKSHPAKNPLRPRSTRAPSRPLSPQYKARPCKISSLRPEDPQDPEDQRFRKNPPQEEEQLTDRPINRRRTQKTSGATDSPEANSHVTV